MIATKLIADLEARGIKLELNGEKLRVKAAVEPDLATLEITSVRRLDHGRKLF